MGKVQDRTPWKGLVGPHDNGFQTGIKGNEGCQAEHKDDQIDCNEWNHDEISIGTPKYVDLTKLIKEKVEEDQKQAHTENETQDDHW